MSGQGGTKVIIIKKKAKHAGHHGGAWKVAYADFVTAMMALFIVLWLLTQTDEASKAALAEYFRTGTMPGGTMMLGTPSGSNPPVAVNIFDSGSQGAPSTEPSVQDIGESIKKLLLEANRLPELAGIEEHVRITETPDGTLIELIDGTDNFLFKVGSPELKPGAVEFLSKLAPALGKLRNKLEIHGHTDSRQYEKGAKTSNWDLSFLRANQARRVLEQNGVALGRISTVQAHADAQLLDKQDPYSAVNRRLAILVRRLKRKPVPSATQGAKSGAAGAEPNSAEPAPEPQP